MDREGVEEIVFVIPAKAGIQLDPRVKPEDDGRESVEEIILMYR